MDQSNSNLNVTVIIYIDIDGKDDFNHQNKMKMKKTMNTLTMTTRMIPRTTATIMTRGTEAFSFCSTVAAEIMIKPF